MKLKIETTEGTEVIDLQVLLSAVPVQDVTARKLFDDLIFHETAQTDGAVLL